MRTSMAAVTLACALVPAAALAEPAASPAPAASPYTLGARIGGYGFRNPDQVDSHGHTAWNECRMNGVGMFGRRTLGRLFVETGADVYFTESFPMEQTDEHQDRISGLITGAAGADLVRTRHFVGQVQVGVGMEVTRFTYTDGVDSLSTRRVFPLGFVGVGGEIRVGKRTGLGAQLRTHIMGNFDAAYGPHDQVWEQGKLDHLEATAEVAAQGQFYLSYQL